MSDYENGFDDLPLFGDEPAKRGSGSARAFNERKAFQRDALQHLRAGLSLSDVQWKRMHPGSRIAPVVEKLRNAHGFDIQGEGSVKFPYFMTDVHQMPTLIAVTPEIKEAYYETPHWKAVRKVRMERDEFRCVLCDDFDELRCHHVFYRLFEETISDLITVCEWCHEKCHTQAKLAFPSGMKFEYASRLANVEFESWLLPKGGAL